jgi:hypothetical protein
MLNFQKNAEVDPDGGLRSSLQIAEYVASNLNNKQQESQENEFRTEKTLLPTAEKWLFCQFLEVLSKMVLNSSFD